MAQLLSFPTDASVVNGYLKKISESEQNRDYTDFANYANLMLNRNPRIRSHFNVRTTAVSSFGWTIQYPENPDGAVEVKNRVNTAIQTVLKHHATTPFWGALGFTASAVVTPLGNSLTLTKIPNGRILPKGDLAQLADENTPPRLTDIDPNSNDYLVDVGSSSILADIALTEFYRQQAMAENYHYIKVLKGIVQLINKEPVQSDEEKQKTNEAMGNAQKAQFVTSGEELEIKVNELTKANSQAFADFIERSNHDIAIACLGQANTTEIGANGSRSALQVLKMISADIHFTDMLRVQELINRLLLIDYRLNSDATAMTAPYFFEWNWEEEQNFKDNAIYIGDALQTGLPFRTAEIYSKLGLSQPEEGEETIKIDTGQTVVVGGGNV